MFAGGLLAKIRCSFPFWNHIRPVLLSTSTPSSNRKAIVTSNEVGWATNSRNRVDSRPCRGWPETKPLVNETVSSCR